MGTQTKSDSLDFNVLQFEKTLLTLRDTQESINSCCQWCLENRQYHKKIVTAWLNVLKRVKVEQRLVLFYLANDVVQYSKRRNYEYVGSWGTALQKATTLVREDRVKHKILRIFKIWEQRAVYTEDFIADLCGLINVSPGGIKNDDPHEFQATYVINKIKTCSNLEKDTDAKLKMLKEHNPKMQISENLITSLKDRAHVDDVEKETDVYVKHMEGYINALKAEIKSRIALISVLRQAETQLESDRKDVKLVAHAYKTFGQRVKALQKKLEEHMENLPSPLPSPDINAPSPSPDADLELPEDSPQKVQQTSTENNNQYNNTTQAYYNPATNTITTETETSNFLSNGFSSFIGNNVQFDISSNTALFPNVNLQEPVAVTTQETYQNKTPDGYNSLNYNPGAPEITTTTYAYSTQVSEEYTATDNGSQFSYQEGSDSYPSTQNNELYDPLEQSKTWESNETWNEPQETDTPESPPMYEKEGYGDPVEYHDGSMQTHGAGDVDQRVLPGMGDMDEPVAKKAKGKDVDHRNLISLTGSPGNSNDQNEDVWMAKDQDYRNLTNPEPPSPDQPLDKDYRLQFHLDLPPPPPPPSKSPNHSSPKNGATHWPAAQPPLPMADIDIRLPPPPPGGPPPGVPPPMSMPPPSLERPQRLSTSADDMDLSDEERHQSFEDHGHNNTNQFSLQPPPPLPDLLDDVDANQFLDEISNEINEFSNLDKDDMIDMEEDEQLMDDISFTGPPPDFQGENDRRDKRVPPGPPPGLPPGMQHMASMQPPPPPPKPGLLGDAPTHLAPLSQGMHPPEPPMPPMNFLPPGPMPNELNMDLLHPPMMPSGNWMGDNNSEEPTAPWSRDPRFRNMAPPMVPAPLPPMQNEPEFYMDDFNDNDYNGQLPPMMPPSMMSDYPGDYPGEFPGEFPSDFQNFPMDNFDNFDRQDFFPPDNHMDFQPRGGRGRSRNRGGGGFHKGNRGRGDGNRGRGDGNRGRGDGHRGRGDGSRGRGGGNRRDHRGGGFRGRGGGGGFRGGNFRGGF